MGTDTMRRGGERRGARLGLWMTGEHPLSAPRTAAPAEPATRAWTSRPPYAVGPDDPRLVVLRREAAARLRPVCAGMPAEAFEALVRDVAAFRLRWAPC